MIGLKLAKNFYFHKILRFHALFAWLKSYESSNQLFMKKKL